MSASRGASFLCLSPHLFSEPRTEPRSLSLSLGFIDRGAVCSWWNPLPPSLSLFPLEIIKHTGVYMLHTAPFCLAFSFILYTLIINSFKK